MWETDESNFLSEPNNMASLLNYINQKYEMNFWLKCLVGMLIITGVELLFGLIFNIILKEHVWDYSGVPLNFLGQVCVPFSLLWFALSGVAFKVIDTGQENIGI